MIGLPPQTRVKGVGRQQQGVHKRLPDCQPICSVNDSHFMWLNLNYGWMQAWKQQSVTVPNDCLNDNLLEHHQMQYIITGKISNRPGDWLCLFTSTK